MVRCHIRRSITAFFVLCFLGTLSWLLISTPCVINPVGPSRRNKLETFVNVTGSRPTLKPRTERASCDLFTNLIEFVKHIPETPGPEMFNYVINVLSKRWHHNAQYSQCFKSKFEETTNMSTYKHMMLTQENTQLGALIQTITEIDKVNITEEIFNALPKRSLLPSPPYESCSVVGNSGALIGSNCGKAIDDAHFVFRFNLATTTGFEEDVGIKRNVTTMNPSMIKNEFGSLKTGEDVMKLTNRLIAQNSPIWLPQLAFPKIFNDSFARTNADIQRPRIPFIIQDYSHWRAFYFFWKQYGIETPSSSGFYFLSCALALCKNVQVFGFWPFATSPTGELVSYHYYDKVSGQGHDIPLEFKVIVSMHRLGLVKLQVGNCAT